MTPTTEFSPTEFAAFVDEDCSHLRARIITYLELARRGHKADKYTLAFALIPDAFVHLYRLFAIPGIDSVKTIQDVDDLPIQPPTLEDYPHFCTSLLVTGSDFKTVYSARPASLPTSKEGVAEAVKKYAKEVQPRREFPVGLRELKKQCGWGKRGATSGWR